MKEVIVLALVTAVSGFVSARYFDVPKIFTLQKADWTPEPESWQKWIFAIWTLAGPLYLLWGWHSYESNPNPPDFAKFQYGQKLIGDLWSAGAVMFGVFWGLKKLR